MDGKLEHLSATNCFSCMRTMNDGQEELYPANSHKCYEVGCEKRVCKSCYMHNRNMFNGMLCKDHFVKERDGTECCHCHRELIGTVEFKCAWECHNCPAVWCQKCGYKQHECAVEEESQKIIIYFVYC